MLNHGATDDLLKRIKPDSSTLSDEDWNKCEENRIEWKKIRLSLENTRKPLSLEADSNDGSGDKTSVAGQSDEPLRLEAECNDGSGDKTSVAGQSDVKTATTTSGATMIADNTKKNDIKIELGGADKVEFEKENVVNDVPRKKSRLSASGNRRDMRDREIVASDFSVGNPPRKVNDDGLSMTHKNQSKNSVQYRCKVWRSTGCKREIKVNRAGEIMTYGSHTANCYFKAGVEPPDELKEETREFGAIHNEEMWMRVSKMAKETVKSAGEIWDAVNGDMIAKYGSGYQGLRKDQVQKLVYKQRAEEAGVDAVSKIEAKYSGKSSSAFLRQSSVFADKDKIQRMMCFAIPELLKCLLYARVSKNAEVFSI